MQRLSALVSEQSEQIGEYGRALLAIWKFLTVGANRGEQGLYAQLDEIASQVEELKARMNAQPKTVTEVQACPASAAAPPVATAPPAIAPLEDPASALLRPDFADAFAELARALNLKDSDQLRLRIETGAAASLATSGDRTPILVKGAFNLLARGAPSPPFEPVRRFLASLLGPAAELITPRPGEALDPALHADFSNRTTGAGDRVRDVIFPGVRHQGKVLVRAIVAT